MVNSEIELLLPVIDRAFDHKSWHGTNLRGAIKGIGAEQAAWRPSPRRHNIWEIIVHAACKVSNLALITGIAAHDLYHAGQIQLLKRLSHKEMKYPQREYAKGQQHA